MIHKYCRHCGYPYIDQPRSYFCVSCGKWKDSSKNPWNKSYLIARCLVINTKPYQKLLDLQARCNLIDRAFEATCVGLILYMTWRIIGYVP